MTVANPTTVASEDHCYPSADSMRYCADPLPDRWETARQRAGLPDCPYCAPVPMSLRPVVNDLYERQVVIVTLSDLAAYDTALTPQRAAQVLRRAGWLRAAARPRGLAGRDHPVLKHPRLRGVDRTSRRGPRHPGLHRWAVGGGASRLAANPHAGRHRPVARGPTTALLGPLCREAMETAGAPRFYRWRSGLVSGHPGGVHRQPSRRSSPGHTSVTGCLRAANRSPRRGRSSN